MTIVLRGAYAEDAADPSVGAQAHAEGTGKASGARSHAEGQLTSATAPYAHAEGISSIASGTSSHAEGESTEATNTSAHAEGVSTDATGTYSHAEGSTTVASGTSSHSEGNATTAAADYSHAGGSHAAATRRAQFARSSGWFTAQGDSQWSVFSARRETTDATPSLLVFSISTTVVLTGNTINVLTVPVGRAHRVRVDAIARRTDTTGDYAAWTITLTVVRDATGSARIIGTPTTVTEYDGSASAWTLVASINTGDATNNYLALTATGEAAKTIRWVAKIETVEVG